MKTNSIKWILIVSISILFLSANAWADGRPKQPGGNKRPRVSSKPYNHQHRVKPGFQAPQHRPEKRPDFGRYNRYHRVYPNPPGHHRVNPPNWRYRHPAPHHGHPAQRTRIQRYPHQPVGAGYVFSASLVQPGIVLNFSTGGIW